MRHLILAALAVSLAAPLALVAQTPDEPPELARARQEVERVRSLVEAGAAPARALEDAEAALAEARDGVELHRLLYGQIAVEELTEEQAGRLVSAAERRWETQKLKLEEARVLVEQGVVARTSLTPHLEELDRARKTLDLARSRARLLKELAELVKAEEEVEVSLEVAPQVSGRFAERYDGDGVFLSEHLRTIVLGFEKTFGRPLPVSARGDTALHRAMRFDHRGRVDVALNPDTSEGVWLRQLLEELRIPYFAFRGYAPGRSTAAHIHIGPPSGRLPGAD